jgi:sugar phosphate isomerase/epimerase
VADIRPRHDLVASFFTLTGAGFGEPPRHSFVDRCRAASEAGFTGIGLHVDDLPRTLAAGMTLADMQTVLDDTGLRVVEIEFLGGWATPASDPGALDRMLDGIEAVADAFGGRHVSAGEFRGDTALDPQAPARLDAIARRLGRRGLQIAVEAFPWSVLAGPTTVEDLLARTREPNIGHLVDVWHFWNNGGDPANLSGPIAAVQLNDGSRVRDDFLHHARTARQLPGEGELDVAATIRAVQAAGFTGPWCVEVNTPAFRSLPVREAALAAAHAATTVLDAAGVAPRRSDS